MDGIEDVIVDGNEDGNEDVIENVVRAQNASPCFGRSQRGHLSVG